PYVMISIIDLVITYKLVFSILFDTQITLSNRIRKILYNMTQRKKQVSKLSTSKATNTKSKVTNTRATRRTRKAEIFTTKPDNIQDDNSDRGQASTSKKDFEDVSQVQEISDNDYVFVQDKALNMQQNESDDDLESTLI
ncbi:6052_t:CDS:2, partial [Funneliformis caledonium]